MPSNSLHTSSPSVNGWNAEYLDEQYRAYKTDPASLSGDLISFFQGFDLAIASEASASAAGVGAREGRAGKGRAAEGRDVSGGGNADVRLYVGVLSLIDAHRRHGHYAAMTDPFGRVRTYQSGAQALDLAGHGLAGSGTQHTGVIADCPLTADNPTVDTLLTRLQRVYGQSIGAQFMHLTNAAQRAWWVERLETIEPAQTSKEDKLAILNALLRSEGFEKFLGKRYSGEKRFSLEGGEALIAVLERILEKCAEREVREVVIGMAHRGRLNVLNNILGKSYEQIFTEFEDSFEASFSDGGGDVKYHRGYSSTRALRNGRTIHLSLSSNPSHLEAVGGVTLGRARAKQRLHNDTQERRKVIPVLIHGDAAVIGQGVVAEALNLSRLEGYKVGGTLHIVTNNLIGFTTLPEDGRSGPYCTDLALAFELPVLHVSGEDPVAAVRCAELLTEFRNTFSCDTFLDLVCFRKFGHNEQDEASFTQPILDKLIKAMKGVVQTYAAKLITEGVLTPEAFAAHAKELEDSLEAAQKRAKDKPFDPTIDPMGQRWAGMGFDYNFKPVETGISPKVLVEVCTALGTSPEGFNLNPKLTKMLADRGALPESGLLSHADAELIAFGSLLLEGNAVRLSGQDSRRGTFSQRHAVLRDFVTGEPHTPLNAMRPNAESPDQAGPSKDGIGKDGSAVAKQARFCVYDSPLSEFAVMGFDYGYSLADPSMLVLWEGQFGDFCNGAQTIIDQFIASAEIKWERYSGLTLLLPHGYEGAGPEHSSARLERFLQLCGSDNMQVCYPTTGAQMFHLLRRQVRRNFRKPLIVMTPKSMLRTVTSHTSELLSGHFQDLIDDVTFVAQAEVPAKAAAGQGKAKAAGASTVIADRRTVRRVVLCCGKIYHELHERRKATSRSDVAIVRIEQLYPFNAALFKQIMAQYPANVEMVYVQEESRNAGGFTFIADVLTNQPDPTKDDASAEPLLANRLKFIGRPQSATPATGSKKKSKKEQEAILAAAIGPAPESPASAAPPAASPLPEAKPATSATTKPAEKSASSKSGK